MIGTSEHILGTFEAALRELKTSLLTMASVAQQNLDNAAHGLLTRDTDLCNEVIAEDDEVNALEKAVDQVGVEILLRFNPVASDLRHVVAAMKIANNLERISDHAESLAKRARKIIKQPEVPLTRSIEPIYEMAAAILRDAVRSFAEGDVDLALTLNDRDNELDKAHRKLIKELTREMENDPSNLRTYLHLVFVVRCLERVGDLAVNVGEDTVFAEAAADIRHVGPSALKNR